MLSVSETTYLKMQLHAIKYHSFDCLGLLIGRKEGQKTEITDAIPLFHQRVMTGTLETAFDMVETLGLKEGEQIMGVYEAALPSSLTGGKEQSELA